MDISELLKQGNYSELMSDLQSKIKELEPLIEAEGGIQAISTAEIAIKSKLQLSEAALTEAKDKASDIITAAQNEADGVLLVAQEKVNKLNQTSEDRAKEITALAETLNINRIALDKDQTKVLSLLADIEQREASLLKDLAEIARKKDILEQL